ncbi:hypothetical protein [Rhabdothermincola salaria]|uniref:hypothetical protein n=1 Tax=Rhabdothermincola salaria TaxID=2903142 RepID=UPI001E343025|nr:hypothetical protein [Rhabdothermincola salaria]MCD9625602.1 hypothetical protein [Rhabdothermincola salaria]
MSGGVGFLLIVVVITVVGSLVLWLRNRKPTTYMSSVDEFQQEMQALGRDPNQAPERSRRSSRPRGAAPPPSRTSPPPTSNRRDRRSRTDDQGGGQ